MPARVKRIARAPKMEATTKEGRLKTELLDSIVSVTHHIYAGIFPSQVVKDQNDLAKKVMPWRSKKSKKLKIKDSVLKNRI